MALSNGQIAQLRTLARAAGERSEDLNNRVPDRLREHLQAAEDDIQQLKARLQAAEQDNAQAKNKIVNLEARVTALEAHFP